MTNMTTGRNRVLAATLAGALGGAIVGSALRSTETHAQTQPTRFVVTAQLYMPGNDKPVVRLEDTEYNVVCYGYPGSGFLSCTKK
jgi:hypothetical protein